MRQVVRTRALLCALALGALAADAADDSRPAATSLWTLARSQAGVHRFSTLLTAQDVRERLGTDDGIRTAMDWCRATAVTKVYLEVFRDGYQAERDTLRRARDLFREAGFEVSGCVTTTKIGKPSTGWGGAISCYTDLAAQEKVRGVFEYAASLFDEIMIDDFWFTDCACAQCDAARRARQVTVGTNTYPVAGDSWEDYRCELMVQLSRERVLAAARRINPKARLIIKYPQWYDNFHERGYEVVRETADFDRTWVGTETRDYGDRRWGGTVPYEAYFIMRWLGGIGGSKCGGGWYDWLGTTERTYIEQARQTVLGGARESMLFCFGGLHRDTGPKDAEALRAHIPELLAVADRVRRRPIVGIAAYKPANSHAENEGRVFDFVGMLGFPLAPCHEFPADAPAAFFPVHALKDADLAAKLSAFIATGRPVLVTDGLAKRLEGRVALDRDNVRILRVNGAPKSLLALPRGEADALRAPFVKALGHDFRAPVGVGLYLFADGSWVAENFNDQPAELVIDGADRQVAAREWVQHWERDDDR